MTPDQAADLASTAHSILDCVRAILMFVTFIASMSIIAAIYTVVRGK
jgi:hypothetical protein